MTECFSITETSALDKGAGFCYSKKTSKFQKTVRSPFLSARNAFCKRELSLLAIQKIMKEKAYQITEKANHNKIAKGIIAQDGLGKEALVYFNCFKQTKAAQRQCLSLFLDECQSLGFEQALLFVPLSYPEAEKVLSQWGKVEGKGYMLWQKERILFAKVRFSFPLTPVSAAILTNKKGKICICQRPSGGELPNYWEFPGGKQNLLESSYDCVIRECFEELGVRIRPERVLQQSCYHYPNRSVLLSFYMAKIQKGQLQKRVHQQIRWVAINELKNYLFCPGTDAAVQQLQHEQSERK